MHQPNSFSLFQERINKGEVCPYCFYPSTLVIGKHANYYLCTGCDASSECYPDTAKAVGSLATQELRELRELATLYFNTLWETKASRGDCSKEEAKLAGYAWLAKCLKVPARWCNIAMMSKDQCQQVINICKPYYQRIFS
ncbi:MAG TPA: zinc-finger-containing protein [Phormidium sp.]